MFRAITLAVVLSLATTASARPIIFDNITPNGGPLFTSGDIQASQKDAGFGFDAGVADDFTLGASSDISGDWRITEVNWIGRFMTGTPTPIDTFNIIFWPDDNTGHPAGSDAAGLPPKYSEALAIYNNVPATSAPGGGGPTSFEYSASLPDAFFAEDGVQYWIEIQANVNYPPLWGVEMTNLTQLGRPHNGFDLFFTPFWTESGAKHDTAFTLGGEPVPEPAAASMVILMLGLPLLRRRNRA
ncbi:MAG: hypothetical protein HZA51_04610 [Planctomycetes bacterium]|nr:hypothetical protein [Planctomycetota bacterium]